ncbi:hypothetical protein MTR_1g009430 [Medicago truncatula]|uniref:Uncharacterized protein n=1 Tax=Medicago truncatula TaxID=3880 RepID=G7I5P8_MEDTR|nr:hypothetical protein MTR_1g009430 [Medicago truncatula]
MLPKKHLSGSEKRKKKKKRNEELIKSQQGALDKFVFKKVDTQENVPNDVNGHGLTFVEVRRGEWWIDGFATVLASDFNVQFQSLGSILMKIFLAWFGVERIGKTAAFVVEAFGS